MPTRGIRVSAILADPDAYLNNDRYSTESTISNYTASDGTYTLKQLPPGRYLIGVNIDHTPTKDNAFSPLFYPNSGDRVKAAILQISDEEQLNNIDLSLPEPLPDYDIQVSVLMPDGSPVTSANVFLEDYEFFGSLPDSAVKTNAAGSASVKGYKKRKYWLHASFGDYGNEKAIHAEPVELDESTNTALIKLVLTAQGSRCTHYKGSRKKENQK